MQFDKKLKQTMLKGLLFVTPYLLLYFPAVAQQKQTIDFSRPDRANIIDSQRIGWGGQHSAGLHKCSVKGDAVLCWFVITNLEGGMGHDYDNGAIIGLAVVTQKKTTIFVNAPYPARNGRNFSLLNSTPTSNS